MPPKPVPARGAAESLVTVAPLVTRWMERLLAGHDPALTVAQYLALAAISAEELSGADLALRAGISPPAVSQLLGGLTRAGLVERHDVEGDRRRRGVGLTPAGVRAHASARGLLSDELGSLLAGVPRPEADALARLLPRVAAELSGAPPPRRPPPPEPPVTPSGSRAVRARP
jgi:DNA-binding MarR family transcriptional regulator